MKSDSFDLATSDPLHFPVLGQKFFLFSLIFLISLFTVSAQQEQIAFDGFESGGFCGGLGWYDSCWTASGAIVSTVGYSSTWGAYFNGQHSIERDVNVSGYNSINLSFINNVRAGDFTAKIIDGGTETTLGTYTTLGWVSHEYQYTPQNDIITIRFESSSQTWLDNVEVTGESAPQSSVSISMDNNYPINSDAVISMSSTEVSTLHTLELSYSNGTTFCTKNLESPSTAETSFTTTCEMPSETDVDAQALFYVSNDPSINTTDYFNIVQLDNNPEQLNIEQVYFSRQVLQGGNTEIFAIVTGQNISLKKIYTTLKFPDGDTRILGMESTVNENEYRAFITDTFRTGQTNFTIRVEDSDNYDTYSNYYDVLPYSVEYVEGVGYVDKINEPQLQVHGTEYSFNENAKIWLQLLDENKTPIPDALCYVSLYNPRGDGAYLNNVKMEYQTEGIFFYDFLTPVAGGVYPAVAHCYYEGTSEEFYAHSFAIGDAGSVQSGTVEDTWADDMSALNLKETKPVSDALIDGYFNFTVDTNVSEDLLSSISFYQKATWSSATNDNIRFYWYNWSNNNWTKFDNELLEGESIVSNSLILNNVTRAGIANQDGLVKIFFNDSGVIDKSVSDYTIDYMYLSLDRLVDPVYEEVRGSSEVHISSDKNYVVEVESGNYTQETHEGYFYLTYSVASGTAKTLPNQEIELETYTPFPCHHVLNLTVDGVPYEIAKRKPEANDRCIVTYEYDLEKGAVYEATLKLSTFGRTQVEAQKNDIDFNREMIGIACNNYQQANGLPNYTTPLENRNLTGDELYDSCNYFFHVYHRYNTTYTYGFLPGVTPNTSSLRDEKRMNLFEANYEYIKKEGSALSAQASKLAEGLALAGTYSVALIADPYPPTNPLYATYFASISTSYLNYKENINLTAEVSDNLIKDINQSFYTYDSNVTDYTIAGIYKDYLNQSTYMIFSGTEYSSGENGTIALQMVKDVAGGGINPVTGLTCNSTIHYPNNNEFESKIMTEFGDGIYYHDFTVPDTEGVYIDFVDCSDGNKNYVGMHTFHVAEWANTINIINSTTLEINGTVTSIENYLQNTIYSILLDINNTVTNIDGDFTADLSSIETKLNNLRTVVDNIDEFSQEQVFLVTDSVNQINAIKSEEGEIKESLSAVEKNLKILMKDRDSSFEPERESPRLNIDKEYILMFILITIMIGGGIFVFKKKISKPKSYSYEEVKKSKLPQTKQNQYRREIK